MPSRPLRVAQAGNDATRLREFAGYAFAAPALLAQALTHRSAGRIEDEPGAAEAELNAVLAAGRRFVSDLLASLPAFALPR